MSAKDQLIFAAINDGAHKQAQQLITKQLKKQPQSVYYLSLQAYAYLHGNKPQEAATLAERIAAQTPSNPQTLEMLSIVFKGLKNDKQALQIYENAAKKYPTLDLITNWFGMNLENLDVRGMQKAAMHLTKFGGAKQRQYTCYAAVCCLMAVTLESEALSALERKLFPDLGCKLMHKLQPFGNCQEVYLYVKLAQASGADPEVIVTAIETFTGTQKLDLELQLILLETLVRMERWETLYSYAHHILFVSKLDDYATWKHLIASGLKLNKETAIREALASCNSRNASLATIALQTALGLSLHEPMVSYWDQFGSKPCGFPDLAAFAEEPSFDAEQFMAHLDATAPALPTDLLALTRLVNRQRFRMLFKAAGFCTKRFMADNFRLYTELRPLLKAKEKTDFYIGDELILMNCAVLLEAAHDVSETVENAVKCLVVLEAAAAADHHEPHVRLWLVKLYSYLGCPLLALKHYNVMNIKQMQLDTLTHHLLVRYSSVINVSERVFLEKLELINKFYPQTACEVQHFVQEAFENGSYNKLVQMVSFGRMLNGSVSKMLAAVELIKVGKALGNKALVRAGLAEASTIRSETVPKHDNRDVSTHWLFGTTKPNPVVDNRVSIGPVQSHGWCRIQILWEMLITETNDSKVKQLLLELDAALILEKTSPELTLVERWSIQAIQLLALYHLTKDEKLIDSALELMRSPPSTPQGREVLTWMAVHHVVVVSELYKAVQLYYAVHSFPKKCTQAYAFKDACAKRLEDSRSEACVTLKQAQAGTFGPMEAKVLDWGLLVGYDALSVVNGVKASLALNVAVLKTL